MSETKTSTKTSNEPSTTYTEDELFYNPLLRFESRLTELSDRIIPKQPYLLTIPSDLPYRRSNQDPNLWHRRSPFTRREELLQYMSLLPHQDENEELMRVEGDRIDEDDGEFLVGAPSPQSEATTRPSTPQVTGPKKKISLQDYKKDKSVANTPGEKEMEDSLRRQALKSNKEETMSRVAADKVQIKVGTGSTSTIDTHKQRKSSHATPTKSGLDEEPPLKKRRLSSEAASQTPIVNARAQTKAVKEESSERKPLPALLSPTLPAQRKKEPPSSSPRVRSRDLPALLSPRLPTDLEKSLRIPMKTNEARVTVTSTASPRHTAGKALPRSLAADEQTKVDSHGSAKSPLTTTKLASPSQKVASVDAVGSPVPQSRTASPKPRQRHRVILKYGKKNRKRVKMILSMRPARKATGRPTIEQVRTEEKLKPPAVEEPVKVEKIAAERKRPPDIQVEPPAKKQKSASDTTEPTIRSEHPSTPKPNMTKFAAGANSKSKSLLATPHKEPLKSITMQRVASTDTQGAITPHTETKPSTPAATGLSSQPKTSPAPASTPSRNADTSRWEEIALKLHQQGRVLKKEGNLGTQDARTREKASTVIAQIEALLCFMLNTAANVQAHPHAPAQWHTIIPYHIQVWRYSRLFPHLHGLVVQLGAVLRQHLLHEQIRQLSKIHLVDDPVTSAPTPSSDGTTRPSEDPTKIKKHFLDLRDDLTKNAHELRIAWLEATRILSPDTLESQYRHTWRRRLTDTSKRQPGEKVNIRDLQTTKTGYFLPLDPSTNCFEAAGFATAFLAEWTRIEGVEWKSRVEI